MKYIKDQKNKIMYKPIGEPLPIDLYPLHVFIKENDFFHRSGCVKKGINLISMREKHDCFQV